MPGGIGLALWLRRDVSFDARNLYSRTVMPLFDTESERGVSMTSALETFFIELCAVERAQESPVCTAVTVVDDGTVVVAASKGDVCIPVSASRMDIWRRLDGLDPSWVRAPSWAAAPPIPPPGEPDVGWVELFYDLQYLYALEDFGTPVRLTSVSRHGDQACIDLATAQERRRFHVDLRTFVAASAVVEDCVLDMLSRQKNAG